MVDVLNKLRKIAENYPSEDVARAIQSTQQLSNEQSVQEAPTQPTGNPPNIKDLHYLLDEVQHHLEEAIDILQQAERQGKNVSGPFGGQIRAYTKPWLHNWIHDHNQPGSVESLRQILNDE